MNGARRWIAAGLCGALLGSAAVLGAAEQASGDFPAILGELRNAVAHTADLRAGAERGGDRVKSTCAYEGLRGMMQAVDSAEVAQVAWESAKARGDEAAAQAELLRGQQALELVRRLRNEADKCVGRDVARAGGSSGAGAATTVTVETTVRDDDPNAGPVESWVVRPPRLDIPGRSALTASPFRPAGS